MSKYTTEVRFICEEQAGLVNSVGYGDVGEVIDKARPKIFDFPYPIFNESYKPILESKILMHYYTREICEETYGLWKLRLRTRLNDIMPYYNKLYNSELIEYNPFNSDDYTVDKDINVNEDHTDHTVDDNETRRTGDETSTLGGVDKTKTGGTEKSVAGGKDTSLSGGSDLTTNNRADKTDEWTLYSDTPQGGIAGIEGAEDSPSLGDNGYLTNATHVIGDTTGSTSDSLTNYGKTGEVNYGKTGTVEHDRTDTVEYGKTGRIDRNTKDEYDGVRDNTGTKDTATDWLEKVVGYRGIDPNERILKLRETFLNIDNMIIRELRDLFFNIW